MIQSLMPAITLIFFIHFVLFLRFYLKQKKPHHIFATTSFLLLTLYGSARIWRPELILLGRPAYMYLRFSAWLSSFLTFIVYLRNRYRWTKR